MGARGYKGIKGNKGYNRILGYQIVIHWGHGSDYIAAKGIETMDTPCSDRSVG